MKRLILSLCFVIFSMPAFAAIENIDLDGLSDEQRAQLVIKADKMKKEVGMSSEDLYEYAEIGKKYGIALANVAREMGVAVNDIADTFVGKIAIVLIVWKVIGADLVGLVVGLLWLFSTISLWIYFFRRLLFKGKLAREIFNEKGRVQERIYEPFFGDEGSMAGLMFFMLVVLIMLSGTGVIMIF